MRRVMPNYQVELTIPNDITVGITDVVFRVTEDGGRLGTVRISRGAIDFTQRGQRFRLSWPQFAELMKVEGRRVKRKPIPARTARRD
jgi:hypothetical protein